MPLPARDRIIALSILERLTRGTTVEGDRAAAIEGLRRLMERTGTTTIADLIGALSERRPEPGAHELRTENVALKRDLLMVRGERDLLQRQLEDAYDEADRLRGLLREARRNAFAAATTARLARSDEHAQRVMKVIERIRAQKGDISNEDIAAELTRRGVETRQGKREWSRMQVHRVLTRAGK